MPRSTKATSRASTASKRTSKRNTSVQRDVYAIPESPQSTVASEAEETSTTIQDEQSAACRSSSPTTSNRGRSMSTTSTKIAEDLDATLMQARKPRSRAISVEPGPAQVPGFEALEAVNGLYQKLRNSQTDIADLRQENAKLIEEVRIHEEEIEGLRSELRVAKEAAKKAQNKDTVDARRSEDNLRSVLASLRTFSSAACDLMPLLDVLSGAPDIQYDEETDKLFQIMKQYREKKEGSSQTKFKSEPSH